MDVYDVLTEEAAVTPAGADGLFFLPYLAGERTPHADPLARGAFVGLTMSHTRGHLVRSVMEGVTYSLRDCLAIVEELGVKVRQIRASGGGAKSAFWRQMQADVLGKSVVRMAADEGPAYGVALLAAVGAGAYKNIEEACAATVKTTSETKPRAATRKEYDRAFPVYQQLYGSLREDFKKIAALG
jgi:xylulokinase